MKLVFKYSEETKEIEVLHEDLIFDLGLEGDQNGEFRNNIAPETGLILKGVLPTIGGLQNLRQIDLYEGDILIESLKEVTNVTYRVSSGTIMNPDKSFRMGLIERIQFDFKI